MDKQVKTLSEINRKKKLDRESVMDLLFIIVLSTFTLLVILKVLDVLTLKTPQKQIVSNNMVITVVDNKGFATLENKPLNDLKRQ